MHVLGQYAPVSRRCHSRIIYRHGLPRNGERRDIPACTAAISTRDRDGDGDRRRCGGNRRILPSEYPRNAEANYRYVFKRVPNLYRYCIFSARSAFVCSGRMEKTVESRGEINPNLRGSRSILFGRFSMRHILFDLLVIRPDHDNWMLIITLILLNHEMQIQSLSPQIP